jgi:hypothetical protein
VGDLFELRVYEVAVGSMSRYLQLAEEQASAILREHLDLIGAWRTETGSLNQMFALWRYASLSERMRQRSALYSDPRWLRDAAPAITPFIRRQTSTLLYARELHAPALLPPPGRPFLFSKSATPPARSVSFWIGSPLGDAGNYWALRCYSDFDELQDAHGQGLLRDCTILLPTAFSPWS